MPTLFEDFQFIHNTPTRTNQTQSVKGNTSQLTNHSQNESPSSQEQSCFRLYACSHSTMLKHQGHIQRSETHIRPNLACPDLVTVITKATVARDGSGDTSSLLGASGIDLCLWRQGTEASAADDDRACDAAHGASSVRGCAPCSRYAARRNHPVGNHPCG